MLILNIYIYIYLLSESESLCSVIVPLIMRRLKLVDINDNDNVLIKSLKRTISDNLTYRYIILSIILQILSYISLIITLLKMMVF